MTTKSPNRFVFFLLVISSGCVPIPQQISESEYAEIEGYVGPLVIDKEKFTRTASLHVYDPLTVNDQFRHSNDNIAYEDKSGRSVVYRNCGCLSSVKIVQNKLIVVHSYGGGERNRESTILLWNGEYYKNSNGEYIVDLLLFSDKIDPRRARLQEKKILDIQALQREGIKTVWINLIGFDRLIEYAY